MNVVASWPQYESGTKLVLQLQRDNVTSITDGMYASITLHDATLTPVPHDIHIDFRRNFTELLNTPEFLDEWEK